ncbi:HEAT repeat domain-containing protein [Herbiconiux sp. VKM Ac-1786]|uniref:HEAT repeat domain-containing protein n=1 Tax=Herbiconiux sp. VKM Ac-1786 TaxID=2783824 RepID=UPI001889EF57|nr:HEAT repeat domain-containing protein [Herbiconiux sp. VKM Ac-1786]MBF4571669.1 HEAT repeat domain-containing protein [Herbiconiux sp. VKM Ac-1786]
MSDTDTTGAASRLRLALSAPDASSRLQAALTAGTRPADAYARVLVGQCRVEPDFFVRDMLTWALTRHDRDTVVELLLPELDSPIAQARSQALHTLSKVGDPRAFPAITVALLTDADDIVARNAWRTASGLAPDDAHRASLATTLVTQLGRGDRDLRLSLTQSFVRLGEASRAALDTASTDARPDVRAHALATAHLLADPEADFDVAMAAAVAAAREQAPQTSAPPATPDDRTGSDWIPD